ncbi:MAG: hypothetical protein ACXV2J_11850, partial [Actinomycetes bacterium]
PRAEQQAVEDRITELDGQITDAEAELAARGDELRRARAGVRALEGAGIPGDPAALAAVEKSVEEVRVRRHALGEERQALACASLRGLPREDPHAHLRHRALPNVDPVRTRKRVLRVWSAVSASFLLVGLAVIVLGRGGALLPALAGLALVMLCAEAFARGHLAQFVAGLLAAAVMVAAVWTVTQAAAGNWRLAVAVLLVLAAVVLLLANIRDFFVKR